MGDLSEHFSSNEMRCRHCFTELGITNIGPWKTGVNIDQAEILRRVYNVKLREQGIIEMDEERGLTVASAFRCPLHKVEAAKAAPGMHFQTVGLGVDWEVDGIYAAALTAAAYDCGWKGFGWQQKGGREFVHTDMGAPRSWSY